MRKEEARIQLQIFFNNSMNNFNLTGKTDVEVKETFKTAIKRTLAQTKQSFSKMRRKTIHEAETEVKRYQYSKNMLEAMLEVFDEEFDKFIQTYHPDLKKIIIDMKEKIEEDNAWLANRNEGHGIGD